MNNRCAVIISGGALHDEFTLRIMNQMTSKIVIGVDKGVEFLYRHKILPDYIVGDFDSLSREIVDYYKEETKVPIREFNPVKDASDTEIAVRLGITLGCKKMIILGGTGNRMDHLWANVQTLMIPLEAGVEAEILDNYNRIRLIDGDFALAKADQYGDYFSLFPLGSNVLDVTISGAKYPLKGYTVTSSNSMCVSNEIAGDKLEIKFPLGVLVFMESRDKALCE